MKRKTSLLIIALLAAFSLISFADDAKVITPELLTKIKSVRTTAMSPDGSHVAFTVSIPRAVDEASGGGYTNLFLMDVATEKVTPFITGKTGVGSVRWSPCGQMITFTKSGQVWGLPINGGEARQLTNAKLGVRGYQMNADGTKIAYTARENYSDAEKKSRKAGFDVRVVEESYRFVALFVEDLKSGDTTQVTPFEYMVQDFKWSPCGKFFAFLGTEEDTVDDLYMMKKFYLISAEGGERKLLHDPVAKVAGFSWSPEGDKIAWNGGADFSDGSTSTVFVIDVKSAKVSNLTNDDKYTAAGTHWLDNDTLAVAAISYQDMILFTMKADGSDKKSILGAGPIFGMPSFCSAGKTFATAASTAMHPTELFIGDMSGKLEKKTDHNPWLADVSLGKQEVIKWKAKDGLEIQGVLIYPVGFEAGTKYPLVCQPHGGPESADMNGWSTRYGKWGQMLAGQGYFVLNPNYRGSTGRGVAYNKADHNRLGEEETQDVIDGIDYLIAKGYVDGSKVGSGGASYGGYFSAMAATKHSKRYAAAIVFAGITDWYSDQGTAEIAIENSNTHWNIPDWHVQGEIMWAASPVAFIANANTATLIAHGERDTRVPTSQGWELFRALKTKGDVPVQFLLYPRAGHGLRESAHQLDYARRSIAWFNKYLKGECGCGGNCEEHTENDGHGDHK
jgi:dipeptidyl aminopeptidase/acylaminoacyl peptidase